MKAFLTGVALAGLLLPTMPALAHDNHGGLTEAKAAGRASSAKAAKGRKWLAGDHHIHSEFSADYEVDPANPNAAPKPLLGKDGRYTISRNAQMGASYGLNWMVSTDHGGPLHSRLNFEQAYPELLVARKTVPQILIFYGMEFDTPAGDHSSMIIPFTKGERAQLRDIESRFSKREAFPTDPARDTEPKMIEALRYMKAQPRQPVVIANHPSRSAKDVGVYGQYTPAEFRNWNDTAPTVSVGMEGAPGHQAGALKPDGSNDPEGARGGYRNSPTLGGFDQMTARLGGFWDSMLGEGRRWWITATSDSHSNWRDGGSDFWPGEYSKTYVHARRDHGDVLDGLRNGRVFVTTGDLISELDVSVQVHGGKQAAMMGGMIMAKPGDDIDVVIRLRDPAGANHGGFTPDVARVDLIVGDVTGPVADRTTDKNATTRVEKRFTAADWTKAGEVLTMRHTLRAVRGPIYLRVRGTNTGQAEPITDPKGENPWDDLWFYGNPVFVAMK
ncbi:phosphoesterase [Novosphingobium sp.]|uniref:phosphoesterase n=2 Tax=unclassified Novosphingobium TaxID=2644732 RepID=UPI0026303644|nr:phosphoesterase [Novosphingobium sp.]